MEFIKKKKQFQIEYLTTLGNELGTIWGYMDIQSHKGSWITKEMINRKQFIYGLEIDNKKYLYKVAQKKSDEMWEEYTKTEEYRKFEEQEY